MTYLVLARKYRPRSFDTLVGQDHVVRALTHALDTQRLHHAWLFTGTRGVGKTTLSRILAKSLNCETGITSKPCGVCRACTEIDAGRFVDYVELDAASNRGVDEMTQLLEQAVYAPGAGRFKVYMIDEVHMLTGHAFNAMLKTLEEPPPHVKFIIATTDPQKIPVTVLSRCLQFNLKQMPPDSIVGHLQQVLTEENIEREAPALRLIAQAAGGSMRDALSLTDQAIAYSAGNLTEEAVRGMLGTIDQRHLVRLIDALAVGDANAVLDVADELSTRGLSYAGALGDMAVLLSRIAVEQRVKGVTPPEDPLAEDIARLAGALHPDAVQLFYSVAVHSRGELALAPDEYAGFVMTCLRMLALLGDAGPAVPRQKSEGTDVLTASGASAMAAAGSSATAAPLAAPASTSAAPVSLKAPAPTIAVTSVPAIASAPPLSVESGAVSDAASSLATGAKAPAASAMPRDAAPPPVQGDTRADALNDAREDTQSGKQEGTQGGAQNGKQEDAPPWHVATAENSAPAALPRVDALVSAPQADAAAMQTQDHSSRGDDHGGAPVSAPATATVSIPVAVPAGQRPASPTAATAAGEPPDWVNEAIPDDAQGNFSDDPVYIAGAGPSDDDEEFETLGMPDSIPPSAIAAIAAPNRASTAREGARSTASRRTSTPRLTDMTRESWPELAARLPATGLAAEVARQSEWCEAQGDTVTLRVAVKTLADSNSRVRLQTLLCEHFGRSVRLEVVVGATGDSTAHAVEQSVRAAHQLAAEEAVAADPFVQALLTEFSARVIPNSIRHVDLPSAA